MPWIPRLQGASSSSVQSLVLPLAAAGLSKVAGEANNVAELCLLFVRWFQPVNRLMRSIWMHHCVDGGLLSDSGGTHL